MRLLYSTRETYPTFRVDLTELFSHQLAMAGWVVSWHMRGAAPGAHRIEHSAQDETVHVGAVARSGRLSWLRDLFLSIAHDLRLWGLVRRGSFDAVQVRDKPFAGLVAAIAARVARLPFFYWMSFPYPEADIFRARDPEHPAGTGRRAYYRLRGVLTAWLLYRVVLPMARHVFVQSDRMLQDVAQHGIPVSKMTPVPMGIDVDRAQAAELAPVEDARIQGRLPLVYLGTMVRLRRVDVLLQALALVREQEPRAILVMIGNASERDMSYLHAEAARLGLSEHVIFTGFVPLQAAWSWVRVAAVCLSPCRPSPVLDCGTPTKIIEYLAWGKPVVANHHPDQTAVIESSHCGVLVDFSASGFAQGVLTVLRDASVSERAARLGREWVRQHRDYPIIAGALDRRYRELLASPAAAASAVAGGSGR